ncbi:OVARIAN TUMOR DOMAIN-containing deubiquitinating enzyme 4 isoform X2 [Musa acuminata AAA Group]|uniref:Ubiquitin thioesterase OTU n=1 Tax=Musa acuminata subsp. malaccensis TaxID=214687 RepID=A0A804J8R6_MUSAM|nr:PREDICTED: OTU domain-containing protein At3g57810-like isoform X2 [Musa acuminata subsp. malaccensis]
MFSYMSPLWLTRSNSSSLCSRSSLFQRRHTVVSLSKSFRSSSTNIRRPRCRFPSFTLSKHKGSILQRNMDTSMRLSGGKFRLASTTRCRSGASLGLYLCFTTSGPVYAEPSRGRTNKNDGNSTGYSHGKKIYTDYSITGIPGDGRCLFRSVMHGACLRSGKLPPDEKLQRELADELRARVADEFVKRRAETEWFVEGDFDTYVSTIRKPHVWGGEPELFMASHVLEMPITVYMLDEDAGGLIAIAEYGQEYGKDDPICVLYHGFGHYEALQIPGRKGSRSRL